MVWYLFVSFSNTKEIKKEYQESKMEMCYEAKRLRSLSFLEYYKKRANQHTMLHGYSFFESILER